MRKAILFALILVLAVLPFAFASRYIFHIATMIAIMIPLACSLNLMLQIGQMSMAHPAFMGLGGYTCALLMMKLGVPPLLSLFAGGLVAAIFAVVFGPVFLRIKGVYFVLLTYAFGQIVNLVFQEWTSLFGGNSGLYGIPKFSILGWRLTQVSQYYVLAMIFAVMAYLALRAIERSDMGAMYRSLNEDEMLSRSLGADALAWRIAAFTITAFIAGVSGGIYALYIGFLSPDAFGWRLTVDLLLMNVVGGASAILGPLVGAVAIVPLPELLRDAKQFQLLIYGCCLIVFLLFLKDGLISLLVPRRRKA